MRFASGRVRIDHVTGSTTGVVIGIGDDCDVSPNFGEAQDVDLGLPSVLPSGTYYKNFASTGVFTANAGVATTYCVVGNETGPADVSLGDINLVLLYVPTAYGTVRPALPGTLAEDGVAVAPTMAEINAERIQSMADNEARMQAEMEEMRAMIESLQAALAEQQSETAEASPKQYGKEDDSE